MRKKALTLLLLIFFMTALGFSFFLQKSFSPEKSRQFFYVPPFQYINAVSGSFRGVCADIFYIRAILSVAEPQEEYLDYVLDNLRLATALDSRITSAYVIGGIVAPRGNKEIPAGIQFLKEGMERNPTEWRIPFWIAFNYYQLQDYQRAAEFYEKASRLPNAPRYLKGLISFLYYQSGQAQMGVKFLEGLRESVKDPALLKQIDKKLEWLKNIVFLEEKVREFKNRYGSLPKDLEELVSRGLIQEIPRDPFGQGYYLDSEWYNQQNDGRVKSRLP